MKTSRSTTNQQSKQGISKKPSPEIRDNLDSHSKSEQNKKTEKKKTK